MPHFVVRRSDGLGEERRMEIDARCANDAAEDWATATDPPEFRITQGDDAPTVNVEGNGENLTFAITFMEGGGFSAVIDLSLFDAGSMQQFFGRLDDGTLVRLLKIRGFPTPGCGPDLPTFVLEVDGKALRPSPDRQSVVFWDGDRRITLLQ